MVFCLTLHYSTTGTGSGVFEPFYDEDMGVMFLMANGDSSIKFWEMSEEAPYAHFLTENLTSRQQAGIARLPKTTCDVRNVCGVFPLRRDGDTNRGAVSGRSGPLLETDGFHRRGTRRACAQNPGKDIRVVGSHLF